MDFPPYSPTLSMDHLIEDEEDAFSQLQNTLSNSFLSLIDTDSTEDLNENFETLDFTESLVDLDVIQLNSTDHHHHHQHQQEDTTTTTTTIASLNTEQHNASLLRLAGEMGNRIGTLGHTGNRTQTLGHTGNQAVATKGKTGNHRLSLTIAGEMGNQIGTLGHTGNQIQTLGHTGNQTQTSPEQIQTIGHTGNQTQTLGHTGNQIQTLGHTGNQIQTSPEQIQTLGHTGNQIQTLGHTGNQTQTSPEQIQTLGHTGNQIQTLGHTGNQTQTSPDQTGNRSATSRGKTGSQAFHYIEPSAVLETHGIPTSRVSSYDNFYPIKPHASSPLYAELKLGDLHKGTDAPTTHPDTVDLKLEEGGVPRYSANSVCLNLGASVVVPNCSAADRVDLQPGTGDSKTVPEIGLLNPTGTKLAALIGSISNPINSHPDTVKLTMVPENSVLQLGTVDMELKTVPGSFGNGINGTTNLELEMVPESSALELGTVDMELKTVPETPRHNKIGTQNMGSTTTTTTTTVPDKSTENGTDAKNITKTNTNGDHTLTQTVTKNAEDTAKKRRRRKREEERETKKARLYEQGPLSDQAEERKRKDAIRAKNCRDRNRERMEELQMRLEEKIKENQILAQELEGRRSYERVLLQVLREKHGIAVTPFVAPDTAATATTAATI